MTDITATSAKVKWEKPEDDGGVPIKEYEIEKLDTKTGKWVRVGKVPGTSPLTEFEVTGLNPGGEYKFRVTAVNDEGDSEPLESERPIIARNPYGQSTIHPPSLSLNSYFSIARFYFSRENSRVISRRTSQAGNTRDNRLRQRVDKLEVDRSGL